MTLYARREPTNDAATAAMLKVTPSLADPKRHLDVQVYYDREATRKAARYPWYYSNKPTRRNKRVTHNCANYDLEWLPDA